MMCGRESSGVVAVDMNENNTLLKNIYHEICHVFLLQFLHMIQEVSGQPWFVKYLQSQLVIPYHLIVYPV